jgi:hypothetical protein
MTIDTRRDTHKQNRQLFRTTDDLVLQFYVSIFITYLDFTPIAIKMKFLGLIVTTAIAGTSSFAPVSRTFVNRDGELFPVRKYLR